MDKKRFDIKLTENKYCYQSFDSYKDAVKALNKLEDDSIKGHYFKENSYLIYDNIENKIVHPEIGTPQRDTFKQELTDQISDYKENLEEIEEELRALKSNIQELEQDLNALSD